MTVDPMLGARPDPSDPNLPSGQKAEAEGPPPPRLRMLGIRQLRDLKPAQPIIEGLLYRDTLVQLAGNPGSYKSFITIGQACAVATGQPSWEGHRIKHHGPVMYIAAEGVQGIWLRAAAWCHLTGVPIESLDGKLFVIDGAAQMANDLDMTELIGRVKDTGAVLVIWDTRARCTTDLEENSATEQGKAIRAADRVRSETNSTQYMVHHTTKAGTGGGRGSNAWDGAVWSDLRLKKEGMTAIIQCEKHKDVPAGCEHRYDMKLVIAPIEAMPGATEEQRTTLVATQADDRATAGGGSMLTLAEEKIDDLILEVGGQQGLSKTEAFTLSQEAGMSFARPTVFRAVESLFQKKRISCVDPKKRGAKYISARVEDLTTGV